MPQVPPEPSKRRASWLACLAGVALLSLVGLAAVVAEPFLIALAVPPTAGVEPRSSAGGWGNTAVWLAAEAAALVALLFVGFIAKWLSPRSSWVAPCATVVVFLAYLVFAQFPATRSLWRIALWSLGSLSAIAVGAWLAAWVTRRQRVALYLPSEPSER